MCGHATLASSKIIFVTTTLEKISFINRENVELKIRKIDGIIIMQFPVYETCEMDVPKSILDALSIDKTLNTSSLKTGMMTTELFTDKVLIYGEAVTVFEGEFKN